MKIVLAPNAFKDSLSAIQTCNAMAEGIHKVLEDVEIIKIPIADGGDGLVDIALHVMNGKMETCRVHNPLGKTIEAGFCHVPEERLSIIEMASSSGLRLLSPDERNPLVTSTYGTGELIKSALDLNSKTILVGLGGSATNDGGTGMAAALGMIFLDKKGKKLIPNGENLANIHKIDGTGLDERIKDVSIEAICDVTNRLLGETGASIVYGPQKGASPEQVKTLELGLANLADKISEDLKKDVRTLVSGGAAGGLGAGLFPFWMPDSVQELMWFWIWYILMMHWKEPICYLRVKGNWTSKLRLEKHPLERL